LFRREDDERWVPVELPMGALAFQHSGAMAFGERLQIVGGGRVHVLEAGAWRVYEPALPSSAATSMTMDAEGLIWALTKERTRGEPTVITFHRSVPPEHPVQKLDLPLGVDSEPAVERGDAGLDLALPRVAGPGCESIFVLLFGITKYAAKGYDFPTTR